MSLRQKFGAVVTVVGLAIAGFGFVETVDADAYLHLANCQAGLQGQSVINNRNQLIASDSDIGRIGWWLPGDPVDYGFSSYRRVSDNYIRVEVWQSQKNVPGIYGGYIYTSKYTCTDSNGDDAMQSTEDQYETTVNGPGF